MNYKDICNKLKERLSANIVSHNGADSEAIIAACQDDNGELLDNTAYNILTALGAHISRRNKDVVIEVIKEVGEAEFFKSLNRT